MVWDSVERRTLRCLGNGQLVFFLSLPFKGERGGRLERAHAGDGSSKHTQVLRHYFRMLVVAYRFRVGGFLSACSRRTQHGSEQRSAVCCRRHPGVQKGAGEVLLPHSMEWLWRC